MFPYVSISAKSVKSLLSLVAMVMLALGCGNEDDGGSGASFSAKKAIKSGGQDGDGTWQAPCVAVDYDEDGEDDYALLANFTADDTNFTYTLYSFWRDPTCEEKTVDKADQIDVEKGTFVIGEELETFEGAVEIDFTTTSVTYILTTDDWVAENNAEEYCGVSWEKDVAVDVIGLDCSDITREENEVEFNILKIADSQMHFGNTDEDETNGTSKETRPTALSSLTFE